MSDYLDTNVAAQALDLQIIDQSVRGYGVATGVTPSKGSNPLETEVTAGMTIVNGTSLSFSDTADQSVLHDAGGTDPRRDVVYIENITGDAVLQIQKGTPMEAVHAQGDGTVNFADAPFEFSAPAPPSMNDFDGTPVAEVAVPAGVTDYVEADHFRSLRSVVDLYANSVNIESEHKLPEYDNVNNAAPVDGNIIYVSGDGVSDEGIYVYDGSTYIRLGEDVSLSDLSINGAKDWGGNDITNVGTLEVEDTFRVANGRGSFSLPDQHTRYAGGLNHAEVARWSLPSDERLEVSLLEVAHHGGGTADNITAYIYDEDQQIDLALTNDRTRVDPPAVSNAGADITLRVTNSTGDATDATISGQLFRVLD